MSDNSVIQAKIHRGRGRRNQGGTCLAQPGALGKAVSSDPNDEKLDAGWGGCS